MKRHKVHHRIKHHKIKHHRIRHSKAKRVIGSAKIKEFSKQLSAIRTEMSKTVVGQDETVSALLCALLSGGHVLVEGVPGIAKTLIVRTLAEVTGGEHKRIQFTADLLPTDIVGITTYSREKGFEIMKGPIFANFVLADEINRSPPKVQSALLEAMQESQATIGKKSYGIPAPFFVMATQNPIESLGVYQLPEAQLDRFLFKIYIKYPMPDEERMILKQNITLENFEKYKLKSVVSLAQILRMQEFTKKIYLDEKIEKYIVKLVDATRHPDKYNLKLGRFIEWGASPRASIGLFIASKANTLLRGGTYVTPFDVKSVAHNILRHRILLNYEGQAEGIKTDQIIDEILARVPV